MASSSGSKPKTKVPTDDDTEKKTADKTATESVDKKAQKEIKALKAELVKQQQKKRHASPEEPVPSASRITCRESVFNGRCFAETAAVAPRPLKGASLANPNKKARKYQAIEFESDED